MAEFVEVNGKRYASPKSFTLDEMRTIKQISGGMGVVEAQQAIGRGDPDAIVAFLTVVMQHNGEKVDPDSLWKLDFATINFVSEPEEDVADDPALPPPNGSGVSSPGEPERVGS